MNSLPDTRASLLLRVRDPEDRRAWEQFVEIYRPVILRLAARKRLQPADAEDVAQQVLISIARAAERFEYDPARARFRHWLSRVAHNAVLNALARRRPDRGTGNSSLLELLNQQDLPAVPDSDLLRLEHRREVFRWAARQVRPEFEPPIWDAFWLTAVENRPVVEVARQLGKKPGAIYTSRSRVLRRIQQKVWEYEKAESTDNADSSSPDSV